MHPENYRSTLIKNINACKFLCKLILFLLISTQLSSQQGEHFVQNYLPKHYGAEANNFGVTQDNNGLIFVANYSGVLIFDGISWDMCKRADEIAIQSIAKTSAGEIVVGTADGDIAMICKNKRGKFQYKSLLNKLSKENCPKEIIRQIVTLGKSTYFLSADKLIEYKDSTLNVYKPKGNFHSRFLVMGKHIFVNDIDNHLSVLDKGRLISVKGTENLSGEKYFFCYKLTATEYAVGYRNNGVYIAHYDSLHPENTFLTRKMNASDKDLIPAEINNGCLLRNGNFIVTTNKKGAFELNKDLQIVNHFDSQNGVYDDNVKSAFQDVNGNLWLPLYYGITFVETNSNLFNYGRSNGITGPVQSACYFENKLFIATDKGVQYYDSIKEKFVPFKDFNKQSWYLFSCREKLFIGTAKGLFVYSNGQIVQVSENNTFCILGNLFQSDLIYIGTEEGIEVYSVERIKVSKVKDYNLYSAVKSITSDANRNIYFSTVDRGLFFLNYQKSGAIDSIQINVGAVEQETENTVFSYKGRLLIGTGQGIYTVKNTDRKNFSLIKDPQFWPLTKLSQVFRASQMGNGLICSQKYPVKEKDKLEQKITYLEQDPKALVTGRRILNHLSDVKPNLISNDSNKQIVFICADEGLFILNDSKEERNKKFNLTLNKFITKTDTLMENISSGFPFNSALDVPYGSNDISVLLGFTSYETSSIEFCSMLGGRDKRFTKWDKENALSFNNLYEGNYILKVKARTELEEKEYAIDIPFKILPPWYRSVYAYIVYLILFIGFVYVVVKLNSRRLVAQNKKLEKTIEERTSTISSQKEEIEHKQKEILDSINYAQRIQRALLASEKLLKENLPDHFVFFQPKDVVSGDFYWASALANGQFALVTADSTGHGVPGAIMSMLNISCLKEAVEAEKLTAPNNILNHARKKVIETLANDGSAEGGKDGMDCSLVCFDLKNNQFSYAAANNPVWVVRGASVILQAHGPVTIPGNDLNEDVTSSNKAHREEANSSRHVPQDASGTTRTGNSLELIELSPDKMPVGKHDRDNVSFNQHTFALQKGDMIYTLTDGLPDQFGGPKGKKFMYKKLKEFLISISQLPLAEQKTALQNSLNDWKGNLEQVDDVCIIGVHV